MPIGRNGLQGFVFKSNGTCACHPRSNRESLFTQGLLSNKPLVGAFILTLALQMATIYVPALNPVFIKTEPVTVSELMLTLALSSVVFFAVKVKKLFRRDNTAPTTPCFFDGVECSLKHIGRCFH